MRLFKKKDRPIFEVYITKELKDTGQPGRPFYAKVGEYKKYKFLGLLIAKISTIGNFPDPEVKS